MVLRRSLACLMAFLPAVAAADDVYLNRAGRISGRILSRTESSIEIDVGAGTVTLPMSAVLRVEERRSPLHDYHDRASALPAGDVEGWRALARWASQQGLDTQARGAFGRVLADAPDDAEANTALGRVRSDGHWITEEESYLARGYVWFDGTWLPEREREAILRHRREENEAQWKQMEAEARAREADLRAREMEVRAREAELRLEAEARARGMAAWQMGVSSWVPWPAWGGVWPAQDLPNVVASRVNSGGNPLGLTGVRDWYPSGLVRISTWQATRPLVRPYSRRR